VPAEADGIDGRIVSISQASGLVNLNLRQEDADLVLWFRNPLSVKRSLLAWYVPHVFAPDQVRDILYAYDGSDLSTLMEGRCPALIGWVPEQASRVFSAGSKRAN
jgi:hypothetical protein